MAQCIVGYCSKQALSSYTRCCFSRSVSHRGKRARDPVQVQHTVLPQASLQKSLDLNFQPQRPQFCMKRFIQLFTFRTYEKKFKKALNQRKLVRFNRSTIAQSLYFTQWSIRQCSLVPAMSLSSCSFPLFSCVLLQQPVVVQTTTAPALVSQLIAKTCS